MSRLNIKTLALSTALALVSLTSFSLTSGAWAQTNPQAVAKIFFSTVPAHTDGKIYVGDIVTFSGASSTIPPDPYHTLWSQWVSDITRLNTPRPSDLTTSWPGITKPAVLFTPTDAEITHANQQHSITYKIYRRNAMYGTDQLLSQTVVSFGVLSKETAQTPPPAGSQPSASQSGECPTDALIHALCTADGVNGSCEYPSGKKLFCVPFSGSCQHDTAVGAACTLYSGATGACQRGEVPQANPSQYYIWCDASKTATGQNPSPPGGTPATGDGAASNDGTTPPTGSSYDQLVSALDKFITELDASSKQILSDPNAQQVLDQVPELKDAIMASLTSAKELRDVFKSGQTVFLNIKNFDLNAFVAKLKNIQQKLSAAKDVSGGITALALILPDVPKAVEFGQHVNALRENINDLYSVQLPKLQQALAKLQTNYPKLVAAFQKVLADNTTAQALLQQLDQLKTAALTDLLNNLMGQAATLGTAAAAGSAIGLGDLAQAALTALTQTLGNVVDKLSAFQDVPGILQPAFKVFFDLAATIIGEVKPGKVPVNAALVNGRLKVAVGASGTTQSSGLLWALLGALPAQAASPDSGSVLSALQNLEQLAGPVQARLLGIQIKYVRPESVMFANDAARQAFEDYRKSHFGRAVAGGQDAGFLYDFAQQMLNAAGQLNDEIAGSVTSIMTRLSPATRWCPGGTQSCPVGATLGPQASGTAESFSQLAAPVLRISAGAGATGKLLGVADCIVNNIPAQPNVSPEIKKLLPADENLTAKVDLKDLGKACGVNALNNLNLQTLQGIIGELGGAAGGLGFVSNHELAQATRTLNALAANLNASKIPNDPALKPALANLVIAVQEFGATSDDFAALALLAGYQNKAIGETFMRFLSDAVAYYAAPAIKQAPGIFPRFDNPNYQLAAQVLLASPRLLEDIAVHWARAVQALDGFLAFQPALQLPDISGRPSAAAGVPNTSTPLNYIDAINNLDQVKSSFNLVLDPKTCSVHIKIGTFEKTYGSCQVDQPVSQTQQTSFFGPAALADAPSIATITAAGCGDGAPICGKSTMQIDLTSGKIISSDAPSAGEVAKAIEDAKNSGAPISGATHPGENGQTIDNLTNLAIPSQDECKKIIAPYSQGAEKLTDDQLIAATIDWTNGKLADDQSFLKIIACRNGGAAATGTGGVGLTLKGAHGPAKHLDVPGLTDIAGRVITPDIFNDVNGDDKFTEADCDQLAKSYFNPATGEDLRTNAHFNFNHSDNDPPVGADDVATCRIYFNK